MAYLITSLVLVVGLALPALGVDATAQRPAPTKPSCFTYDPAGLSVIKDGAVGWRVVAGKQPRWLLDSEADANAALQVAAGFSKSCRVPNLSGTGMQFFESPTGQVTKSASVEDCLPYSTEKIVIAKDGAQFNLIAAPNRLAAFRTAEDALAALDVAKRARKHCFVGRSNRRPDRLSYIFEYWR